MRKLASKAAQPPKPKPPPPRPPPPSAFGQNGTSQHLRRFATLRQAGRDNSRARRLSGDGLAYLKAFKFRMLQIERSSCLVTGARMRGPEFLRFGPRLEGPLALPHGMRGIERMVFRLRAPEQMKLQETRNPIEIRIASQPYFFKCVL